MRVFRAPPHAADAAQRRGRWPDVADAAAPRPWFHENATLLAAMLPHAESLALLGLKHLAPLADAAGWPWRSPALSAAGYRRDPDQFGLRDVGGPAEAGS